MQRIVQRWSVEELSERFGSIEFPEYQREPNVWPLSAKQRLIDSMARQFDIAAFYLYATGEDSWDCVDGRQRIGAIMSFLGYNTDDNNNGFRFVPSNEIYSEEHRFEKLRNMTFDDIKEAAKKQQMSARAFKEELLKYRVTVVVLSEVNASLEFNLQFTRLNLGTIINSGEKLHAMVGDLRDECFEGLGQHRLLKLAKIPKRRYAKQQLTAQILAQVFSLEQGDENWVFARTRHVDLQKFFKRYTELAEKEKKWIGDVRGVMDGLASSFSKYGILRSRAMVVSMVLLAYEKRDEGSARVAEIAAFMEHFLARLREQVKLGLRYEERYQYLIEFQRHVTQASVEGRAVAARARVLRNEFARWRQDGKLTGE